MIQAEKSWRTDPKSPNVVMMHMLDSQIHKIIFVFQVLLLIKSSMHRASYWHSSQFYLSFIFFLICQTIIYLFR